jgi:Ran GTPase-activating protein (RanGAP) involved in mRNA processing and transport
MNRNPHWIELHEILTELPSPLTFRALIALLDTWPADDANEAIQVAERALSAWPDQDRLAPWSWGWALAMGYTKPTWRLVRRIEMESNHLGRLEIPLSKVGGREELQAITELFLGSYTENTLTAFRDRANTWPNLSVFQGSNDGETKLESLATLPIWHRLRELHAGTIESYSVWSRRSSVVPEMRVNKPPLEVVTLYARDLMALWDKTALPHLHTAKVIIQTPEEAEQFARRPELSDLASLTLALRCGRNGRTPGGSHTHPGNAIPEDDAAAEAFFSRCRLPGLNHLAIVGNSLSSWSREGMGNAGLDALIRCGLLQQLTHLRLELLPLGDMGIESLATALPAGQLETLELMDVFCHSEGADALARSAAIQRLEVLNLSANEIGQVAVCHLAATAMPCLRSLDLSGPWCNPYYVDNGEQPVEDSGAAAWADSPNAETLRELKLRKCSLTDAGLKAIAGSVRLSKLSTLDLSHSSFSADSMSAWVNSNLWNTLRELHLNDCRLDDIAIKELTRVPEVHKLRSLHLAYNSIGHDGAQALADWSVLSRLWELNLHDNFIGDKGLIALAQSPNAARLLELDLEQDCWNSRQHWFNDEVVAILAEGSTLTRMDTLCCGIVDEYCWARLSTGFTKEGWERLNHPSRLRLEVCASLKGLLDCDDDAYIRPTRLSDAGTEKIRIDSDFRYEACDQP